MRSKPSGAGACVWQVGHVGGAPLALPQHTDRTGSLGQGADLDLGFGHTSAADAKMRQWYVRCAVFCFQRRSVLAHSHAAGPPVLPHMVSSSAGQTPNPLRPQSSPKP